MPTAVTAIVEQTIRAFCLSFLESPYLCYTEHGAGLSQLSEETCVRETVYDPACGTGGMLLDAENVPGTDHDEVG